MSNDLGTIFGNIVTGAADSYFRNRFAAPPPSSEVTLPGWDDLAGWVAGLATNGDKVEVTVDPMTGMPKCKPCKRRRRRRRALVTASEIAQLSALQGVLGNGKNFQTWIATRKL